MSGTTQEKQERGARAVQLAERARTPELVQLGLGLPAGTLARVDRLRACTGLTRGQVINRVLSGQRVEDLERANAAMVRRFGQLAESAGMTWEEYARDYAKRYSTQTFPPMVAEIEQGSEREGEQEETAS